MNRLEIDQTYLYAHSTVVGNNVIELRKALSERYLLVASTGTLIIIFTVGSHFTNHHKQNLALH